MIIYRIYISASIDGTALRRPLEIYHWSGTTPGSRLSKKVAGIKTTVLFKKGRASKASGESDVPAIGKQSNEMMNAYINTLSTEPNADYDDVQ